jgi:predicted phosphodiesterase
MIKKNICIVTLFIFIGLSLCGADFRFAVMSDSQGYDDGINTRVLKKLMERLKSEDVKFILFSGDMIRGSVKSDVHEKRLSEWKRIVSGYGMPFYIAAGNHEITSERSENIIRSVFEMPENGPEGMKELVYSFDYERVHFIAVDTNSYSDFHRLGEKQLLWLIDDLEDHKGSRIFIFGHEPSYPVKSHRNSSLDRYPSERDNLWDILKSHGVSVYFCGHEHLYNRSFHEGVWQIITGGCGGSLDCSDAKGGYYHYVLVDVSDEGDFVITVKDAEGNIRDIFVVKKGDL